MRENYIDIRIDRDFIFCPISKSIMRHPVFASDGYHYELEVLHQYIRSQKNCSPFTNKPFTFVQYDRKLKNTLDHNYENHLDRYDDYQNIEELLAEITPHLPPKKETVNPTQLKIAICKSLIIAASTGVLNFHFYGKLHERKHNLFNIEHLEEDLRYSLSIQLTLIVGILDLGFRLISKDQFGFFGAVCKLPVIVSNTINNFLHPNHHPAPPI